jgi:hypothetical protein
MENLEHRIQQCLISKYSSPERFGILRVLGEIWEKEIIEKSKIPIFDIEIALPPIFFGSTITLLENKRFQANNIGVSFQAIFEESNKKDANAKGLVYKFGWCKGTILGEYLYLNSQMNIISITPVVFEQEKMPGWFDKGDYFDIGDWIDYCNRYDFALSLSIIKWFDVPLKTSQEWIEKRTVSKTYQIKRNIFELKYKRVHNIAEKMFP